MSPQLLRGRGRSVNEPGLLTDVVEQVGGAAADQLK